MILYIYIYKMNPAFLERMLKQQQMSQVNHPHGISINTLQKNKKNSNSKSKSKSNSNSNSNLGPNILIIPPGIGKVNMLHFQNIKGVSIAHGVNNIYVNDNASFISFEHTIHTLKPDVIVAGSRGTALITRMLSHDPSAYKGTILLFGPVHLHELIDILKMSPYSKRNKLVIVHGTNDTNERIENVRALVSMYSHATLIEATTKGHDMGFNNKQIIMNIIDFV
jgi:hypothetical protein